MFEERLDPVLSEVTLVWESDGLQSVQAWGVLVFSTDELQYDVRQLLVAQQTQSLQITAVLHQVDHHRGTTSSNQ